MKKIILPALAAVLLMSTESCQTSQNATASTAMEIPENLKNNPLLQVSKLQYQAPDFSKIKDEHFKPAFDFGLKEAKAELAAIANNPAPPTFENTLVALEKSGKNLKRAQTIFYNLTGSNTNPTLQALQEEYAPIFSSFSDEIYLNEKLYNRIKAISTQGLDQEDRKLLSYYLENFDLAGATVSADKKDELKNINQELAVLSTQFSNMLLAARKDGALVLSSKEELSGLSDDEIAAAKALAEKEGHPGKYMLALQNTTQQPALQSLNNRTVRQKLFEASWNRANKGDANDTRNVIEKLALLRMKKAHLMGKPNFASWKLQDQMAKTPEAALELMNKIATPAIQKALEEEKVINEQIKSEGENFSVQPWDWNYYAEKVRKAKYGLDENSIRPYFEVQTVLEKGVFYAAEKFYGITFVKRNDLPVYHPDVVAYEVFDQNGKSIALYYLDFYTRPSKNGGAWMSNFVDQSKLLGTHPVIVNVFNYQKPAPGKPSLISYDDVETMFHEFGHSIHGIFANQKYASLSGTNVPRDFVEFPSQINEHFALEPEILKNYAKHYQTGATIPQDLIDRLKKAKNFNGGYATTELVQAALLDMKWHTVSKEQDFSPVLDFEKKMFAEYGFDKTVVPSRYRTPYFAHIWGGGYSAGYYAYIWAETLDADAWEWIKSHGGITRENGERYKKYILSVGNSKDLNEAYKDFTGRAPSIEPLLRMRGFIQ